ncbi:2360_t:CDS:10 [Ambispora gerdemannii]|uniref:2360_t:CDS:1 n=1 Tax=Ambispora gerdemannii TaxID=144530 RepID=A0A9N9F4W6_9GLOM|nr:2360_t:CDS:10 [Ambispora gerdemannii]
MALTQVFETKFHFINFLKYFLYLTILATYSRVIYTSAYSSVSYTEDQDNLIIFDSYVDVYGTIVMRMIKNDSILQCNIPGEPRMHLRLVFSNGTVRPLDFDFPVNKWNYCPTDWIYALLVEPNLILLNYFDFSDAAPKVNGVYRENGVLVDYWGNIKNNFLLGFGSYNRKFTIGFSSSSGILRTYQLPNGNIGWNRFTKPDENGQISDDGEGFFYNKSVNENIIDYRPFSLLDGGFGCTIVTQYISQSPLELQDATFPQWNVYASFLRPGSSIPTKPFLQYQTPVQLLKLELKRCAVVFDGTGNECLMIASMNRTVSMKTQNQTATTDGNGNNTNGLGNTTLADLNTPLKIYSSIQFRSYCSVIAIQKLNVSSQMNSVNPLFYGGYVIYEAVKTDKTGGDMLDRDGNVREKWSADERYRNPNIDTTFPTIGAVIPANIAQISITYSEPVILSSGNITIYQEGKYGSADMFRQGGNQLSQSLQITVQEKKVSISVLDSTFNVPNATYYIIVDTNFVRDSDTSEALLGMDKESWRFTTEPYKTGEGDNGRKSGIIRLTPAGTIAFKNSLKSGSSIYENISNELAKVIPISRKRLEIKKKYQIDGDQILLRLIILPSENNSENSVQQVISNLKTLIKYKDITSISKYNYTEWLDSSYGFQESIDLLEKYKLAFLIAIAVIFLIAIVFFLARRKNKKGQNTVIITSALILQDIVFDFTFVIFNGKDVPKLFKFSLLTLIIPVVMNCVVAFYVILSENSRNDKFNSWLRKYPQVAAALTLIASGDVVILHVLTSQVAGLKIFSATFSEHAETVIFTTSTLNLLIEDIPQFIIRIYYWLAVVEYDIILLISLCTSALVLLNTLIGRLYLGIIHCQKRRSSN